MKIGTDPEAFLVQDNTPIGAVGKVGGTKEKPKKVKGGAIQEDNVLAEFNIEPATSKEELVKHIRNVEQQLIQKAGMDIDYLSSYEFTKDYLIDLGDQALNFGCDPDWNCWSGEENQSPSPYTTLRTAGGHVHVGDTGLESWEIARLLDVYLGVPSVIMDDDTRRRTMYGQAGAFRPKPYGAEYRVLSNFWLRTDELIQWVWDNTEQALSNPDILKEIDGEVVQTIINSSDTGAAREFCEEWEVNYYV